MDLAVSPSRIEGMCTKRRMRWIATGCCAAGLVAPAPAAGAGGGPVEPVQGGSGAAVPGHAARYVAFGTPHGTLVARLVRGAATRWSVIPGDVGVPGAAFDGSTTGLAADGRTLVLAALSRRYPPRRSRLVVLDTRRLQVRQRITLRGFFAVDAISPSGRWLYLIHYPSARNVLRYAVRTYDLRRGRLLTRPVVDPREPDEAMRGTPIARTLSADGRWAYTLYQRPQGAPFVHALDTRRRTAACIDLDRLKGVELVGAKLVAPSGSAPLRVESRAGTHALIDRRTFAVSAPRPPARRAATAAVSEGGDMPWPAIGGTLALLGGLGLLATRARRRSYSSPGTP
jgi:hypothetical protein